MGFWGSSLYANDCTCDVRDSYMDLLENGASKEDAYKKILDDFSEYIGTDEEPLFWYALADTQWRVGRLDDEVKEQALSWIRRKGGEELWLESRSGASGWLKTLAKLEDKLNQPQPKEKRFPNLTNVQWNPWNMGDVYAYCFHGKEAEMMGYSGKYILLQKIGEEQGERGRVYSCVRAFDKIFTEIPVAPSIENIRPLPFSSPEAFVKYASTSTKSMLAMRETIEIRRPRDYPRKHLQYIGNYHFPITKEHHLPSSFSSFYDWGCLEKSLISFHLQWQDYDYQLETSKSIVIRRTKKG